MRMLNLEHLAGVSPALTIHGTQRKFHGLACLTCIRYPCVAALTPGGEDLGEDLGECFGGDNLGDGDCVAMLLENDAQMTF